MRWRIPARLTVERIDDAPARTSPHLPALRRHFTVGSDHRSLLLTRWCSPGLSHMQIAPAPTATLLCLAEAERRPGLDAAVEALPEIAPPGGPRWILRHLDSAGELVEAAVTADAVLIDLADPYPALARLTGRDLPLIAVARAGQRPRDLFDAGGRPDPPRRTSPRPCWSARRCASAIGARALQGHIDYPGAARHPHRPAQPPRSTNASCSWHCMPRTATACCLGRGQPAAGRFRRTESGPRARMRASDCWWKSPEALSGCLRRSDLAGPGPRRRVPRGRPRCSQDLSHPAAAAEKMLAALQQPDQGRSITASMGIAVHPRRRAGPRRACCARPAPPATKYGRRVATISASTMPSWKWSVASACSWSRPCPVPSIAAR
ncbi:MAG: hypothetical protein U5R48_15510 [Gammaproteobacteria bacterium]|nr:hypothetical protein [Gammaproteobacteria bacterium]